MSWAPSPDTTLTILSGYRWEPNSGFRNFLNADGPLRPIDGYGYLRRDFFVSDPNAEKAERTQAWIGYEVEHRVNDALTLRQKLRYSSLDREHRTLLLGRPPSIQRPVPRYCSAAPRRGGTDSWDTLVNDNQVEHPIRAGLDYRDRTRRYRWGFNGKDVPGISLARPIYRYDFSRLVLDLDQNQTLSASQVGVFLQDQTTVGDLHLLAGLRENWAKTAITDAVPRTAMRHDDSALPYSRGALYTLPNGVAPYVSYATSFESAIHQPPTGNTRSSRPRRTSSRAASSIRRRARTFCSRPPITTSRRTTGPATITRTRMEHTSTSRSEPSTTRASSYPPRATSPTTSP